ncbi:hypothetical protein E5161_00970 [Cohnella pontilimi]|uniref:Uncharacterized protein n=1 Tax=Cohnella pontilimi TaxID=2564100 RepID=A0A4U0FGF9_9BACL|nr:hypothetical protein [Cohnella pontilimi]TJY44001.1 hypothetical protein E5161_00970 [Cohnella pontilimi]
MRIVVWSFILGIHFLFQAAPEIQATPVAHGVIVPPVPTDGNDTYQPEALRRGGGFRSGRIGYNPGVTPGRTGVTPGTPGRAVRTPGAATPAPRTGFGGLGGLFGGFVAGSLLGHLFNPFGFGGAPGGFSLIGLLFWGVIIYLLFRLFRRRSGTR